MPRKTETRPPAPNPFRTFIRDVVPVVPAAQRAEQVLPDWEIEPPDIDLFVTSKDYLNMPPLTARQRKVLVEGVGASGKDLFNKKINPYNEIVLAWGKGSGKDLLASILIAYLSYVVLCLRNPQQFLGLAPGENIDIVNVASRQDQARDVFFSKLSARIKSKCFRRFGPRIKNAKIEFGDRNVNLYSLHSRAQQWDGFNLFAWVMDEADAFRVTDDGNENADDVYDVLRKSAVSRFPAIRWLGVVISYPRSEHGFILTHIAHHRKRNTGYTDIAATWEVHPYYDPTHPQFQDFPFVRVGEYVVPEPFAEDFDRAPRMAAMTYMCIPPPVQSAFFENPDQIGDCTDHTLVPAVTSLPITTYRNVQEEDIYAETGFRMVQREQVAIEIGYRVRDPEPYPYYIHCDPGETKDSFALVLGHTLPEQVELMVMQRTTILNRTVVDLVLEWEPGPNRPVDFLNARDVIMFLCRAFPVLRVTFDKFQSAPVIQELQAVGINARSLSFSNAQQLEMFRSLKLAIGSAFISWPGAHWPLIEPQLRYLQRKGNKITHDERISKKDVADALAAFQWQASGAAMGPVGRAVQETVHPTGGSRGAAGGGHVRIVRKRISA